MSAHRSERLASALQGLLAEGYSSYEILRYAANLRRVELESRLHSALNGVVASGPFVGMRCPATAHASVLCPKLIGSYEKEIQSDLLALVDTSDCFIDIGCAEGYYTTGIARYGRIKTVVGVDISEKALVAASLMAKANGVGEKCFFGDSIADGFQYLSGEVMVMIDVDGAEIEVIHEFFSISSTRGKSVQSYTFIVETDYGSDGTSNRGQIVDAFAAYGYVPRKVVPQQPELRVSRIPDSITGSFLDLAIAGMEGRPADQSWVIFAQD